MDAPFVTAHLFVCTRRLPAALHYADPFLSATAAAPKQPGPYPLAVRGHSSTSSPLPGPAQIAKKPPPTARRQEELRIPPQPTTPPAKRARRYTPPVPTFKVPPESCHPPCFSVGVPPPIKAAPSSRPTAEDRPRRLPPLPPIAQPPPLVRPASVVHQEVAKLCLFCARKHFGRLDRPASAFRFASPTGLVCPLW